jgi:hypothetical protein
MNGDGDAASDNSVTTTAAESRGGLVNLEQKQPLREHHLKGIRTVYVVYSTSGLCGVGGLTR